MVGSREQLLVGESVQLPEPSLSARTIDRSERETESPKSVLYSSSDGIVAEIRDRRKMPFDLRRAKSEGNFISSCITFAVK